MSKLNYHGAKQTFSSNIAIAGAFMNGRASAGRMMTGQTIQSGYLTNRGFVRGHHFSEAGKRDLKALRRDYVSEAAFIHMESFSGRPLIGEMAGYARGTVAERLAQARLRMNATRIWTSANMAAHGVSFSKAGVFVAGGLSVGAVAGGTEAALKYKKTHHNGSRSSHDRNRFASKTPTVQMHGRRNVRTRRDSHGRFAGSY